jgi:diguanylate cyclase (GGDEF)-like protein
MFLTCIKLPMEAVPENGGDGVEKSRSRGCSIARARDTVTAFTGRRPRARVVPSFMRPWLLPLRSIRTQIAAAMTVLVVALAGGLSLALAAMLSDDIEREAGIALHTLASNTATVFADGIYLRMHEVRTLAQSPTLWTQGLESDRVKAVIERLQTLTPYSAWIGVADEQGVVRTATSGLLLGASVRERPWFIEGLRGPHVGDVHPAKLLATLLPQTSEGEPRRFIDFAAPIRREGRVVGVLGVHGSWEWTREVVESLLREHALERGVDVFVFDRAGQPIYARAGELVELQRAGQKLPFAAAAASEPGRVVAWVDGRRYLTAVAPVVPRGEATDLGWSVVVREPEDVAYRAAHASVRRVLLLGLLAAVLACAAGWLFAGRITHALKRISLAASAVERGEPGATIPVLAGSTEVHRLSHALGAMTQRLVQANAELEQRVRERTAELAAANAELVKLASHDALTGLLNRRSLAERLPQLVAAAHRGAQPLAVLMVDIDHFKRVNDVHGHAAGDRVLATVAAELRVRLRDADLLARYGGEEFVALLPATDEAGACALALEIVQRAARVQVEGVGSVTVSCGVSLVQPLERDGNEALRRADRALYAAKGAGRNRAFVLVDPQRAQPHGIAPR